MSTTKYFGFLVITRTRYLGFGPDLVGFFPRSLPQLSKKLRDQNTNQKPKTMKLVFCLLSCVHQISRFQTIPDGKIHSFAPGIRCSGWKCSILTVRRENEEKRGEYYQVLILKVFCDPLQNAVQTVFPNVLTKFAIPDHSSCHNTQFCTRNPIFRSKMSNFDS